MAAPEVAAFGVKANRAIANLRQKIPATTQRANEWQGPIHGRQFTVAGAPADVVADIHAAVVKAIDEGRTLSQFRKEFDQIVKRSGWTYNGTRGWRTALIYRTNMHSAYMAGRWQQILDGADRRPYLEYRSMRDAKVRPQHRAWDGTILPISSPWWRTHYPPNGWNCRCTVRSYSERELRAARKSVSPQPEVQRRPIIDEYDEIADWVPDGIDRGWDHNVGQAWLEPDLALGKRLASLPADIQQAAVRTSVPPEYRQILADRWREALAAGEAVADRVPRIVTFMDGPLIDAFKRQYPTAQFGSVTIAATARSNLTAWPRRWLEQLPELLKDYKAVLVDGADPALLDPVLVLLTDLVDGQRRGVIRMQLNQAVDGLYRAPVVKLEMLDANELEGGRFNAVSPRGGR